MEAVKQLHHNHKSIKYLGNELSWKYILRKMFQLDVMINVAHSIWFQLDMVSINLITFRIVSLAK